MAAAMGSWSSTGSIRGPEGPQGPAGSQGVQGIQGPEGPQGLQGQEGSAGPAGPMGPEGPSGPQGPAGIGINFKGQVATIQDLPGSASQGDAYLVQADDTLRVWDAGSSSWVNGGSIQGPAGPSGPQGVQGNTGPQGIQGLQGPAGAAGLMGPRGTGWFVGSGLPPSSIEGAMDGDLYLDQTTGLVYQLGPFRVADLPAIGDAFEGGYYAGLISHHANGVATHALIVSPREQGRALNLAWKTASTATANTESVYDGYANTLAMAVASHPAAAFVRGLSIGGHDDWYLPANQEWDIIWRAFKSQPSYPGTFDGSYGANPYAVPASANYSDSNTPQTAVVAFQSGGAETLEHYDYEVGDDPFFHWTSTQAGSGTALMRTTAIGTSFAEGKTLAFGTQVRAIRRIPVLAWP